MDAISLRRTALAGAVVAASVVATVGGLAVLFGTEGRRAYHAVGHRLGDRGPDADKIYRPAWGKPLLLVVAGDSVAASLGATRPAATLGANLAVALSDHAHRAVELRTVAVVGAKTSDVNGQLDSLNGAVPFITLVIVGGNDLTNRVSLATSIKELTAVMLRLREMGSAVVVGTCPDFDTLPSLPKPLREVGGQLSRRLATAQFKAATAAGARPVLLGRAVRSIFLSEPHDMFAIDGFHPSTLGYRRASAVIIPAVLSAYNHSNEGRAARQDGAPSN
ncbi:SGNH/GDSL hydrolase family protein [Arthrobacter cryoconiti]|uniref:SGNH/GDSL hydrolase family protein n=1 Tax=Arthrobacter cryoconiti TaxID=748907 RepID=A0ABV8R3R1_9MICC|nr:SGNH/GDSL hydrolase family protein [Arthrobacter cryoconiti]MCC9067232.1 SGNH/GDSL hydrolase family protein [Arthrobacter cryoconiti]